MAQKQKSFLHLGPHGFHRVAYQEWGEPTNSRVLIGAHGAIRHSRDFDYLAHSLAEHWRVITLDLPGRGDSEWLPNPEDYNRALYLSIYGALIARLDVEKVDWIGSSMGGGLGLALAALPGSPIRRLILNDSGVIRGPNAGQPGRDRSTQELRFADLQEVEAHLRKSIASYGIKKDSVWRHFAQHSSRKTPEGNYRLHHDPAATGGGGGSGNGAATTTDPWKAWDSLSIPVLVLRGADSLSLTREHAEELASRGPKAHIIEFEGIGHFPSLTEPHQIQAVREWLEAP